MNIQNIPLTDIHPYARNPRKNDEAVKSVAASIREFGFLVPLVIDAGHEIVAGHTRYKAAQSLGMKEVPCVIADELSDAQIKAFRLADNKVGELASWDMDLLPLELADIQMPMTDFGFEVISDEDFSENFTLEAGEKKPFQQISLTVHDEQAKLILAAIKYPGGDHGYRRLAGVFPRRHGRVNDRIGDLRHPRLRDRHHVRGQ